MPKVATAQASALTEAMFLLRDGIFASSCKHTAAVPVTAPGAVLALAHVVALAGAPAAAPSSVPAVVSVAAPAAASVAALAAVQVVVPAAVPVVAPALRLLQLCLLPSSSSLTWSKGSSRGGAVVVWCGCTVSVMRKAAADLRTQYSEASATSPGVGNKGHTPDPPQQNSH